MSIAESASTAGSPAVGFVIMGLITTAAWVAVVHHALPAVRPQSGPNRMARHERIRRLAATSCLAVLPLILTIFLLTTLLMEPIDDQGSAGLWPASFTNWLLLATVGVGAVLVVSSFVIRTVDRHRMRVRDRNLGLPTPRPPWWPWAVVAVWTMGFLSVLIAGSVTFWRVVNTNFEGRSAALEPAIQAASLDDSVQTLIRNGAPSTVITARVEQVAGVDGEIAALKTQAVGLVVGYGVALLVALVAFVVAGAWLHRRQVRRRLRYDERVTESVTRAAALTL